MNKFLNLRNVIRISSVLLIIFYFIPSFMVSCGGVDVNISAMNSTFGIRANGELISPANPGMIMLLILPAAILVLYCLKKYLPAALTDRIQALIGVCAAGIVMIIELAFYNSVRAQAAGYAFKVLPGYVFTIIFTLLLISSFVPILVNLGTSDTPLSQLFKSKSPGGQAPPPGQSAQSFAPVTPPAQEAPPVPPEQGFTPVTPPVQETPQPAAPVQEATQPVPEAPQQAAPVSETPQPAAPVQETPPVTSGAAPRFCSNCGTPLTPGAKFCMQCGTQIK